MKQNTTRRTPVVRLLVAALLAALAAGGCTSGLRDDAKNESASGGTSPLVSSGDGAGTDRGGSPDAAAGGRPPTSATCAPGPGKQIEDLPDVTIPAIRQPATVVPDQVIEGQTIPGFTVPAVEQPEQVVDTGCVVRYDAPAGCLGAVEISAFTIPGQELPGYTVPDFSVDGRQITGRPVAGDREPAVTVPGERAEQICQREPSGNSRYIASVYRPALYRKSGYRPAMYRTSGFRIGTTVGGGTTLDEVDIPALPVEGVQVPGATVDAARIDGVILPDADGTEVFSGEGKTAYSTQADVLFDFGQAELKPAAVPTLTRIAADLKSRIPNAEVQVDGHTDAIGEDAANRDLSTRRADAVRRWLSTEGGVAEARIRTTGYGESAPVAPNATPAGADDPVGRAKNRRVVISAGAS